MLNVYGPYYSIIPSIAAFLFFALIYRVENAPAWLAKVIRTFAICIFEIYLFSYMFDKLIYPWVMERYFTTQSAFMIWFVPITATVIMLSWGCAEIKMITFKLFDTLWKRIIPSKY